MARHKSAETIALETTMMQIKLSLAGSDAAVEKALLILHGKQTPGEKEARVTVESNGVGFRADHASLGSYMATWILKQRANGWPPGKCLTGKFLVKARNMSYFYVKQLAELALANQARERAYQEAERAAIQEDCDQEAPTLRSPHYHAA